MMVGHRLRFTPTNGHRFIGLSLPWQSPIQVLTGLDVTNFSDRVTEQALVAITDLGTALIYTAWLITENVTNAQCSIIAINTKTKIRLLVNLINSLYSID